MGQSRGAATAGCAWARNPGVKSGARRIVPSTCSGANLRELDPFPQRDRISGARCVPPTIRMPGCLRSPTAPCRGESETLPTNRPLGTHAARSRFGPAWSKRVRPTAAGRGSAGHLQNRRTPALSSVARCRNQSIGDSPDLGRARTAQPGLWGGCGDGTCCHDQFPSCLPAWRRCGHFTRVVKGLPADRSVLIEIFSPHHARHQALFSRPSTAARWLGAPAENPTRALPKSRCGFSIARSGCGGGAHLALGGAAACKPLMLRKRSLCAGIRSASPSNAVSSLRLLQAAHALLRSARRG